MHSCGTILSSLSCDAGVGFSASSPELYPGAYFGCFTPPPASVIAAAGSGFGDILSIDIMLDVEDVKPGEGPITQCDNGGLGGSLR